MGIFSTDKRIYADWAATSPMHKDVARAMAEARKVWANPSAIHAEGNAAKKALEMARAKVARLISARPTEIYFTSGGTEANATIIQGVFRTRLENGVKPQDVHAVSTSIEHSSVLATLREFEKHGVRVTYVAPGPDGVVRAEDILAAVEPATALVTCMLANNEIGTIQPVSKVGAGLRKLRADKVGRGETDAAAFPVFHVDASQAPLWLSCDLEGMRADAMTLDGHKMQGPKGVGALIVRSHVSFAPLMAGGGQERGKRPTTESLELIAGFAKALELAQGCREARSAKSSQTRDLLIARIEKEFPQAVLNGSRDRRLPNNINISMPGISDPEMAVLKLDKAGIACSTKSSCLWGEEDSYVVASLSGAGKNPDEAWRARNTLRFSLAPDATKSDIEKIVLAMRLL